MNTLINRSFRESIKASADILCSVMEPKDERLEDLLEEYSEDQLFSEVEIAAAIGGDTTLDALRTACHRW
jgi:hypothetical protein